MNNMYDYVCLSTYVYIHAYHNNMCLSFKKNMKESLKTVGSRIKPSTANKNPRLPEPSHLPLDDHRDLHDSFLGLGGWASPSFTLSWLALPSLILS